MKLFHELRRVFEALQPFEGYWCLCGGVAASVYGTEGRFTNDIDVALVDTPILSAQEVATQVLQQLGYQAMLGFVGDPNGTSNKQVLGLMVGRVVGNDAFVGIDFLLPIFPWVADAVRRAQLSRFDFGFATLPTIQPEDLIIAKLQALRDAPERGIDLLDIRSILRSSHSLDFEYLNRKLLEYKLRLPEP
jgi:hypothetical protein